jgi:ATP-dependent Lon protease
LDIRRIILPKENEKDLQELPEPVRDQIEFVFAEHIQDALTAAIPELGDRLSSRMCPRLTGRENRRPRHLLPS